MTSGSLSPAPVLAGRATYAGLFFVTLSTLMFEILLTRIFSVSMRYHFAFMAISVALFGITFGATLVYLLPRVFRPERAKGQAAWSSLLFGVCMVASLAVHLQIPHKGDAATFNVFVVLTFLDISIPFVFCGICITLALTQFPRQISRLYATDLVGSSLGCVAIVLLLNRVDGLNAVVVCGALASIGSVLFALDARNRFLRAMTVAGCLALTGFLVLNLALTSRHASLLRLKWVKGNRVVDTPLFEKWNSFSRIQVYGNPEEEQTPLDLGNSPSFPLTRKIRRVQLDIDSDASTELLHYTGDLAPFEFLKHNIVNLAHQVRKNADVCVIGAGGGRDVLSALAFDQKSVIGIEINQDIVRAVNGKFGEFTGHLDRDPRVRIVADEARSYITRSPETYDILQVSMIDTWAATAAGAFVLSENSLYTVEAWKVFLDRLKPGGILSFCRWYYVHSPGEVYRLVALARESLLELGATNPRDHMVLVRVLPQIGENRRLANGLGVLLVCKDPFSPADVRALESFVQKEGFETVLTPDYAMDEKFAFLASADYRDELTKVMPINVAPPTDDSPFFFNMIRLKDLFNPQVYNQGVISFNLRAVSVLGILLLTVTVLSLLFIVIPLATATRYCPRRGAFPLFVFFIAIGLGFMLIEVSQMQRLVVFLGHPSYGLTVILFSLLLASGLGSLSTGNINLPEMKAKAVTRMALLFLVATLFGFLTMWILPWTRGASTFARIAIAIAILFPMGFLMGNAFPLGMKAAGIHWPSLSPILFGINGAMSVFASVCAVAISLFSSISVSFWTGALCYLMAYAAFTAIVRRIE